MIDKIRERLQKKIDYYNKQYESILNRGILSGRAKARFKASAYKEAIDIINQVEAEYNNGWVKCEGKTFAVGCKYLIVDRDNDIYIATYLNDNVFATRDIDYFMPIKLEATYCQLLPLPPQPPKGE